MRHYIYKITGKYVTKSTVGERPHSISHKTENGTENDFYQNELGRPTTNNTNQSVAYTTISVGLFIEFAL